MSFIYTTGIPAAPDNPSVDQPNMQTNTNSIASWAAEDHYGYETGTDGQHKQVRMPAELGAPIAPGGNASAIFPMAGKAVPQAQLFFANSNANFHLSPIRAWGYALFGGGIQANQSWNVVSVGPPSNGEYIVKLTAGATNGTDFAIFVTSGPSNPGNIATSANAFPTGADTFKVILTGVNASFGGKSANFFFMVLQY